MGCSSVPNLGHGQGHRRHHERADINNSRISSCLRVTKFTLTIFVFLVFLFITLPRNNRLLWLPPSSPEHHPFGPLRFHQDGTFHISILEDLHLGENAWEPWGPQQDLASIKVIETILDAESSTSLVVLNGDLITGENTFRHNSTRYLDQIVSPLVQRNLTWASTYGNHDSDLNLSRSALFSAEKRYPNSRTSKMVTSANDDDDEAGITNYFLPVYGPSSSDTEPLLVLYFFDSRGGYLRQRSTEANPKKRKKPQPNWVHASAVNWFRRTSSSLFSEIPSLAFVHIPPNGALTLQEGGIHAHHQPGINHDVPVSQQAQGWCSDGSEGCEYGGQDVPFMRALAETSGLMAVFFGHDHGNTWCKKWVNGVNLCFGQHTGYGGYGHWVRGARQVVVSLEGLKERELDTWIRLETGKAVGKINLNESYGADWYERVPDERTCLGCD